MATDRVFPMDVGAAEKPAATPSSAARDTRETFIIVTVYLLLLLTNAMSKADSEGG